MCCVVLCIILVADHFMTEVCYLSFCLCCLHLQTVKCNEESVISCLALDWVKLEIRRIALHEQDAFSMFQVKSAALEDFSIVFLGCSRCDG